MRSVSFPTNFRDSSFWLLQPANSTAIITTAKSIHTVLFIFLVLLSTKTAAGLTRRGLSHGRCGRWTLMVSQARRAAEGSILQYMV